MQTVPSPYNWVPYTVISRIALTAAVFLIWPTSSEARLTRFVIEQRAQVGQFETLSGHFFGELNPAEAHNEIITDIRYAPRNGRGMVEYSATFSMAKPLDMARSIGVLLYSVPNRGNGVPELSDGIVSVVSGWQGDIQPRAGIQTIKVPIASNADGTPITGPVSARFINARLGSNTFSLHAANSSALSYQHPATLDTSKATLMKRLVRGGPSQLLRSTDWAFADCTVKPFPGVADGTKICVRANFDPSAEYTVAFTAKDPLVLGIGYAATRDLNSFLRYTDKDETGEPNPVANSIKWAITHGNSQSGNFIRSFIHLGFNQDENGRIVWDGANPHIAARQLALNIRFAVPGGAAGPNEPGSEAVLWWNDYRDEMRHRPAAGLLDRCRATHTCPKIFETFGGLEFWYLRESPNLVGTDAKKDLPIPSNVRRYFLPATSHGGGKGGFSRAIPNPPNGCVLPANPNPEIETMRALQVDLIDWVTKGIDPPPSAYPQLSKGELVWPTKAAMGFPNIPGAPSRDGLVNPVFDYDFGPEFHYNDLSGVFTKAPPQIRRSLPTLVPKVDADGMDLGGVPSVLRQAPLGSYLGWNVTADGFDKGTQCTLNGGYIPFAEKMAERIAAGDPRLSLQERYGDHAGYVAKVKSAATKAIGERFLLLEDAKRLIAEAEASDVLR